MILVCRNAQPNVTLESGSKTKENRSRARTEGHNSAKPAPARSAWRIPSSEYVTGINRASHCSGPGKTDTGYMMPPSRLEAPTMSQRAGLPRLNSKR